MRATTKPSMARYQRPAFRLDEVDGGMAELMKRISLESSTCAVKITFFRVDPEFWGSFRAMKVRLPLLILGFALVAGLGYWLAGTAAPRPAVKGASSESARKPVRHGLDDDEPPKLRRELRDPAFQSDTEATAAGALRNQRVLVFKDQAALEAFLKRAGSVVSVLGRLDALNALRIGFSSMDDLTPLLLGEEQAALVFPVDVPSLPNGAVQADAVALGAGLLEWLGITGDHSTWGAGVRVAILDTGVLSSPAFSSKIVSLNLVGLPSDPSKQNGHGTAVASMVIGQNSLTPGVAPGAEIYSIRIANDLGQSDSFLIAQGIVAAVDAGASLINISLGGFGDSLLVRNAIEYANARGALIVAAVGNNGVDRVSFPAANDGVIAVGAVDKLGNHLQFSNTGEQVDVSAPGYGVNAAWTNDQAASVSGTSFSAPIVTGVLAAVKSFPGNQNLTMRQVADVAFSYLNDGGTAGRDSALGAGMVDLGRVVNGKTPGIYDAAVASQRQIAANSQYPNGQLEVLVQNRGTERLVNTGVEIFSSAGVVRSNVTSLDVGQVRVITVPIPTSSVPLQFESTVRLSGGLRDVKPSNDRNRITYAPAGNQ